MKKPFSPYITFLLPALAYEIVLTLASIPDSLTEKDYGRLAAFAAGSALLGAVAIWGLVPRKLIGKKSLTGVRFLRFETLRALAVGAPLLAHDAISLATPPTDRQLREAGELGLGLIDPSEIASDRRAMQC